MLPLVLKMAQFNGILIVSSLILHPRWSKMELSWTQVGSRQLQVRSSWSQSSQCSLKSGFKLAQVGSKVVQNWVQVGQNSHELAHKLARYFA